MQAVKKGNNGENFYFSSVHLDPGAVKANILWCTTGDEGSSILHCLFCPLAHIYSVKHPFCELLQLG